MLFGPSFRVLKQIGEGLNATVYKARISDKKLEVSQDVAFKVLKRKEDIKHFRKELSNLMKVEGSRLVRVFGWRKYRGRPGIIMELIDGLSLYDLQEIIPLSSEEKDLVLSETLEGLIQLKDSGLFHGDLSPKNIMIDVKGGVKLIDFGLSHWRTRQIEVTPDFVSPQIKKNHPPCFETDLDSLKLLGHYLNKESVALINQEDKERFSLVKQQLAHKVQNLIKPSDTRKFSFGEEAIHYKKLNAKTSYFLATILTAVFALFPQEFGSDIVGSGFFVRSKAWMAVRKERKDSWCYTPCRMSFHRGGIKKIHWKSANGSGAKFLKLDRVGFKFLDETSFKDD